MIDKLIGWSLRYRVIVIALAAAFLGWGGFVLRDVPLDVLPDLSAPTVTILVEGHGMAPTEMESLVTFPIEASLNGASGVRRVRSATAVGLAVIWVEFDWGQDIQRARQIVTEKLTLVGASLPPEVEQPFLAPVSSIMGEIMFVALESDRHSPLDLRTVADNVVRRRLLAVPGVSQVIATGGGQKQYQVLVDPGGAARVQRHAGAGGGGAAARQSRTRRRAFRVTGRTGVSHPGRRARFERGGDRQHRDGGARSPADSGAQRGARADRRGAEARRRDRTKARPR